MMFKNLFERKNFLKYFLPAFLVITMLTSAGAAEETKTVSGNDASGAGKIIRLTWVDLAFVNFFPVPGTRFDDFSDMNMGGIVRFNFMAFDVKPLWIFTGFMVDWNKTNSIRLDSIIDFSVSIGAGWRFPLFDRFFLTPKLSYGIMIHAAYGDYYNDPSIYPGDSRAGTKKAYLFNDQYMHYEAEFAYDVSPDSRSIECEVFISPSFIHFLETERQGYEYGYLIGTRIKVDSFAGSKKIAVAEKPALVWGLLDRIHEKDSNEPIKNVDITITDSTGKVLEVESDRSGEFRMEVLPETDYNMIMKKKGYFTIRGEFTTKKKKPGWYEVMNVMTTSFQKSVVGATIEFGNIFYDPSSAVIRPDGMPGMDKMAQFLQDNPAITVELGSHTDTRGTHEVADALSQRRAESAMAYLVKKGIPEKRITSKGYGKRKLKNHCSDGVACSGEEHQANRRTELTVTDILPE